MNRLELLAQEHLALPLAQFLLDLRLDVFLRFEQADLALHVHQHAAQTLFHRERLEQSLLLGHRQFDVTGYEIGELAGVVDRVEHLMHHFFGQATLLTQLGGTLTRLLVERLEGGILEVERHHLLSGDDHRLEVTVDFGVVQCGGALLTLQQELNTAQSALDLADAGNDARREENVRRRLFRVVALGDRKDEPISLEGRFDGSQGAGAARRNRSGDAGEHDRPAQWQDGKRLTLTHDVRSCLEEEYRQPKGTIRTVWFTPSRQGLQLFPDLVTYGLPIACRDG